MFKIFSLLVLAVLFAAGCGIKAETYVMTKQRVGIEKPANANAGYLTGPGKYQEPEKKTRKVYVLELSKPASGADQQARAADSKTIVEKTIEAIPAVEGVGLASAKGGSASGGKDITAASPAVSGPATTYTVQKDDTLQKIAKKVYGSYSKWVKIYDANRDKLKNPNYVKPGAVLTIPAGN